MAYEEVKLTRKGSKTYSYWMASWREGKRTRNVAPGKQQEDGGGGGQGDEGGGAGLPRSETNMFVASI